MSHDSHKILAARLCDSHRVKIIATCRSHGSHRALYIAARSHDLQRVYQLGHMTHAGFSISFCFLVSVKSERRSIGGR